MPAPPLRWHPAHLPLSPRLRRGQALEALAIVNKLRMENINFNKYEFAESGVVTEDASPLDIDTPPTGEGAKKRSTNGGSFTYSIPEGLRDAARIVAEASSPAIPNGDHEQVAASIRRKYALRTNDTNVPHQALLPKDESKGWAPEWKDNVYPAANGAETEEVVKRATDSYWMATMQQRGSSPFAPDGYKVWRNIKEFGAKGDGITDDTAAINRAISEGGRCGANCGSSTIYPAVVYFPPGTYLVSSSIIQYYNTQFLGDPISVPTILAASSFIGLGVITSDVYISDNEQWYINQNNFLRSVKNFKIDVRLTDPNAYVCAIHWQVAQGTSLENIEFYALTGTTQQGIYMENGSGGFLSDLTFVGGNFGAFFGNQQFTTSHLVFVNCKTALQIHWDWAWTMQDIVIESCNTGIIIVGGAGGPMSNGQPVGSLLLTDAVIANTPTGILSSLYAENSTALLVQNTGFFNVKDAIVDDVLSQTLVAGGDEVFIDNWGFGMLSTESGVSNFANGINIPSMNRTSSLLAETGYVKPNFFTRRRPKYHDIGESQIMDVKVLGAKGDGVTDDGPVLNAILQNAANLSSIVYFPFGVYVVKDTLRIPVGSRLIGQAWSQIMAKGSKFENELEPRVMVKVGEAGDVGIVEIQDMLFTVSGATAGAVLVEWNVHESTQGSAGLWDSHFRVGGAIGSALQAEDCPKLSGSINPDCKAASLLLHLTPKSSAYMENVWVWVADHDLDKITQDQIDVYVARGVLIESQGPTWLYGTASEHCVFYQYQLSGASNVLLGMVQTESPYYQPVPKAPQPFTPGIFPNDPTFDSCPRGSTTCAISWAVRMLDSQTVYLLGAGLYSWFSDYSQDCLDTENCQQRGFHIEESNDIWIYNLCTKAIVEMITPVKELVTLAVDNRNGFLSSILAWVRNSSDITIGQREFEGFRVYSPGSPMIDGLTDTCQTALTQTIKCHTKLRGWQRPTMRRSLGNATLTDEICDAGCGRALRAYYEAVTAACQGQNFTVPAGVTFPERAGGTIWTAYNETCLKDPSTNEYCTDVISAFTPTETFEEMPHDELCSPCYIGLHKMMQNSPYSVYHDPFQSEYLKARLEYIYSQCDIGDGPSDVKDPQYIPIEEGPISCFTDVTYTTKEADTCDSIALSYSIASAALQSANSEMITNCTAVKPNLELCIPLTCDRLYVLDDADSCDSIELSADVRLGSVRAYNPWVNYFCDNLASTVWIHGRILCLSPQGGLYNVSNPIPGVVVAPSGSTGYSSRVVAPPEGSTVAEGTTPYCGKWYTVSSSNETCAAVCSATGITAGMFREVNPSLAGGAVEDCTALLQVGVTYCVAPIYGWEDVDMVV
ncbi:pectin lyase-like protein [Aspergillus foveolatus]|uniref:pectin lyase-like protein n=1 Tax=Aspergillus foveolatus TaxID=210207 RepID=UPI003CCD737C